MHYLLLFLLAIYSNIYALFPADVFEEMKKKPPEEMEKIFQEANHKYRTWLLDMQSIRNTTDFVLRFKNADDEISQLLYSKFSERAQKMLAEHKESDAPSINLIRRVLYELNQIIMGPVFYDQDLFQEIEKDFSQETRTLIKWYLKNYKESEAFQSTEATVQLNRFLLEDAYSDIIHPLRRNIKEGSLLSQAEPTDGSKTLLADATSEQIQQRFYDMYAGKTFSAPPNFSETNVAQDPTKLGPKATPKPVEEKSGWGKIVIWILLATACAVLVYIIKKG